MAMKFEKQIYKKLLKETQQVSEIRQRIIKRIENELQKTVVTFFTSFRFPVMIDDDDAVILQEVLQNTRIQDQGLVLILNSLGGLGLAAERIINVCKSYSHGKFHVLIPNQAKSAASMICLGSSEIMMSKTSELGPIDPQIQLGNENKIFSAHSIVLSYEKLFNEAVRANPNLHLEPYLQQLNRYDAREIEEFRRFIELSESIVIKFLKNDMLKGQSEETIKEKIKPFLSPLTSKSHGRPLFIDDARECGLNIKEIDLASPLWKNIWELYIRSDHILKGKAWKIVESCCENYVVPNITGGKQ